MKKKFLLWASVVIILALVFSLSRSSNNYVSAATVGQPLPTPEDNWTRYDTTNTYFVCSGLSPYSDGNYWNGSSQVGTAEGASMTFKINGTRFRVIGCTYYDRSSTINVTIDGNPGSPSSYDATTPNGQYLTLCYDSGTLSDGPHTIVISNGNSYGYCLEIDAIDLPNSTSLDDPNGPTPTPTSPAATSTPTPTPTPAAGLCYGNIIEGVVDTAYNPDIIYAQQQITKTYTVNGAALGDFVQVSFDQNLQGITLTGYVSDANEVTLVFFNGNISSYVDLPNGTVRVYIYRHQR